MSTAAALQAEPSCSQFASCRGHGIHLYLLPSAWLLCDTLISKAFFVMVTAPQQYASCMTGKALALLTVPAAVLAECMCGLRLSYTQGKPCMPSLKGHARPHEA